MQLSYALEAYRECVRRAFCELLLQDRYASELPNLERFKKFLTRVKEKDPTLDLPESCATGLPINWAYVQFNRGPLTIVDEDEFRKAVVRVNSDDLTTREELEWGFGRVELTFWLVANNGSAIEAAEALFYMRLYKIKNITFEYQCTNWKCRLIHSDLQSFEPLDITDMGTGFTVTWTVEAFVPILRREFIGTNVQEVLVNVFDRSEIRLTDASLGETFIKKIAPTISQYEDEDLDTSSGYVDAGEGVVGVPPRAFPNPGGTHSQIIDSGTIPSLPAIPTKTPSDFEKETGEFIEQVGYGSDGIPTPIDPPIVDPDNDEGNDGIPDHTFGNG